MCTLNPESSSSYLQMIFFSQETHLPRLNSSILVILTVIVLSVNYQIDFLPYELRILLLVNQHPGVSLFT